MHQVQHCNFSARKDFEFLIILDTEEHVILVVHQLLPELSHYSVKFCRLKLTLFGGEDCCMKDCKE